MNMKTKILEDIKVCSYPYNMKETIANSIFEIAKMTKNVHLNKFGKQSGIVTDVILLVKCQVNVQFKDRFYDIPINIVIPKSYPFDPPEFYLDKLPDFGLNPKNTDIDPNSYRILVNVLKYWDSYNNSSSVRALQEIIISFHNNFPIYRNSSKPVNQQPQQQLPQQHRPSSESFNSFNSYTMDMGNSFKQGNVNEMKNQDAIQNRYISGSTQINNPYQSGNTIQNINILFNSNKIDDNSLKQIMIDELRLLLEPKIREENKKLRQHEEKLTNYKNEFHHQNDKLKQFIDRKDDILIQINSTLHNIQEEISIISQFIQKNVNKNIDFNEIDEYIHISDDMFLKLVALDSCIEDFVSIFKRLAEKNIICFFDIIKSIRALTREQFKIRFCKEKLHKK